ncbi:hypothetical protein K435DRAFT_849128 [Dendrothele bispora CBS 962.96]|uniref:Uncharacterized protein n=1 Tax=Dendrothele bispora (strain CBS 962.96) TaxID=1314807 RepID=A0A4S8MT19_DENBC|nr:hypothetical protein K435DRAFT_849128 [Dendrothele bispora CBS 962.96]
MSSLSPPSIRNIPVSTLHCDFHLTNTFFSQDFVQQHNLQSSDTIPLNIRINPSKAITFTIAQTIASQYCPKGTQLIMKLFVDRLNVFNASVGDNLRVLLD